MSPAREAVINDPAAGLRERLAQEYQDLPRDEVGKVAEESLNAFKQARVQDFVPVFAWRRARERLRRMS